MSMLRKLYPVIRPMLPMAIIGLVLAVVTAFAQIALLAVSGWFIGAMGLAGVTSIAINYFSPAAIIRALAILRTAGRYAERLATHDAALRFVASLRPWIFERISWLPVSRHDKTHSGSMFDLLRSDIDHLEKFYLNGFMPLVVAVTGVLSASILLGVYNLVFGVVLFFVLVFCGIILPYLLWKSKRGSARDVAEQSLALRIAAIDTIDGFSELLIYGRVEKNISALSRGQSALVASQCKLQSSESIGAALQGFFIATAAFIFFAVGVWFLQGVPAGYYNPAVLAALPLLIIACAEVLSPVFVAFNAWESAGYALGRLVMVTNSVEPSEVEDAESEVLSLSNISFRYDGATIDALKDISLHISSGESMAIAGASGSGKSTLIDVIAGIRDPSRGSIKGGGLSRVAVAEQKPYIFAGTIRSNLVFGNPAATAEEIKKACEAADFDGVLAGLKDSYDTRLGSDDLAALSGGQMRRLSIARALLKKADYVLLDEPDDGLDILQAVRMIKKIKAYCADRGQGLVVVTHNTAVLRAFDRILYIEGGREIQAPQEEAMINFS